MNGQGEQEALSHIPFARAKSSWFRGVTGLF